MQGFSFGAAPLTCRVNGENVPCSWESLDNNAAAGAINSCVNDMINWVKLQLGGGTIKTEGDKQFILISPQ